MDFIDWLDVDYVSKSNDEIVATMNVRAELLQPFGYLHGGVTIALLESVASEGAWLNCGPREIPFGVDVHVAHRSSVKEGVVKGTARLAKEENTSKGYRKQTWDVSALRPDGTIVSEGSIICLIVPNPGVE